MMITNGMASINPNALSGATTGGPPGLGSWLDLGSLDDSVLTSWSEQILLLLKPSRLILLSL